MNTYVHLGDNSYIIGWFLQATPDGLPEPWAEAPDPETWPPRPSPYHERYWENSEVVWKDMRTLDEMKEDASAPLLLELAELDASLVRPLGEITEAMLLGTTPPSAAVTKLQEVSEAKTAKRTLLSEIEACTTKEELDEILSN